MVCFKDWLYSEDFNNIRKECIQEILIKEACLKTLEIIAESSRFEKQINESFGVFEQDNNSDDEFEGDVEDLKFPEPTEDIEGIDPSKWKSDFEKKRDAAEELEKTKSQTMRDLQKELHKSIVLIRWDAMKRRSKDIEKIKALRDKYIKDYGNPFDDAHKRNANSEVQESSEFDSMMSQGADKFNVMEALPLLKKLKYIKDSDIEEIDDEKAKKIVTKALFAAADETGNETPPGVEEAISTYYFDDENRGLEGAKNKFFESIKKIFGAQLSSMVSRQTSYVSADREQKLGYSLFHPGDNFSSRIDDIANQFATHLWEIFTTRETSDGVAEPWLQLKNNKIKQLVDIGKISPDLDDINEEITDLLINYIRSSISGFSSNVERERKLANSPSGPTAELDVWGGNRDKKASLINTDVENNKLDFYKKYMSASDQEREELDNRLIELKSKLKETKKLSKEEHEEKWRLEILQQIFYLHSKFSSSLSLDPSKAAATLLFFRSRFLEHKYRSQSFFGSMGRKTDDGEMKVGDLGLGSDSTAKMGDSDGGRDRTPGSFPNPAASALDNEAKRMIHGHLLRAIRSLKKEEALSICVLWDLGNCSLNSPLTSVERFSNLVFNINKNGKINRDTDDSGKTPDCAQQLRNHIGAAGVGGTKSIDQAIEEINALLPTPKSGVTIRNWINSALEKICAYMKEALSGTVLDRRPRPNLEPLQSPVRRFDASKSSPLASRVKSVPKIISDPETGKRSFEIES